MIPGISFLLNGAISPTSGRYTVILDNVATTLSAKSSFQKQDSLLFYASSLDPNVTHTVKVINEDGGDLSLEVDGFSVFSAESTMFVMFVPPSRVLIHLKNQLAPPPHLQRRHHRLARLPGKGP